MRGYTRRVHESSQSRVLLPPNMSGTENMRSYKRTSMQQASMRKVSSRVFDSSYRDMSVRERAPEIGSFAMKVSFASAIRS